MSKKKRIIIDCLRGGGQGAEVERLRVVEEELRLEIQIGATNHAARLKAGIEKEFHSPNPLLHRTIIAHLELRF